MTGDHGSAPVPPHNGGPEARSTAMTIAVFVVMLLLAAGAGATARRDSVVDAVAAFDATAEARSDHVRETTLYAAATNPELDREVRAGNLAEALQLRHGGEDGRTGIAALERRGAELRMDARDAEQVARGFEIAQAALAIAILLAALSLLVEMQAVLTAGWVVAVIGVAFAAVAGFGVV